MTDHDSIGNVTQPATSAHDPSHSSLSATAADAPKRRRGKASGRGPAVVPRSGSGSGGRALPRQGAGRWGGAGRGKAQCGAAGRSAGRGRGAAQGGGAARQGTPGRGAAGGVRRGGAGREPRQRRKDSGSEAVTSHTEARQRSGGRRGKTAATGPAVAAHGPPERRRDWRGTPATAVSPQRRQCGRGWRGTPQRRDGSPWRGDHGAYSRCDRRSTRPVRAQPRPSRADSLHTHHGGGDGGRWIARWRDDRSRCGAAHVRSHASDQPWQRSDRQGELAAATIGCGHGDRDGQWRRLTALPAAATTRRRGLTAGPSRCDNHTVKSPW